jgi:metal transporter CNNM
MNETLTWLGIAFCLSQSATFSGLNLAVFSLSRLRLEAAASAGNPDAVRVLDLRRDANFTLVTILWGNVAINVLLTLLAESILAGVTAFLFSTLAITFLGEIVPQAFFTRYALRVAATLSPLLRVYRWVLWPVARPVAWVLDRWVGPEAIPWFRETELRDLLLEHVRDAGTEVGRLEAIGAINFLTLDDLPAHREGEPLDPASVVSLPLAGDRPVFPRFRRAADDPFIRAVDRSGKKWVVLTDPEGRPRLVLDAHLFLRRTLLRPDEPADPMEFCHRPLVVREPARPLGEVLGRLVAASEHPEDDVVDEDLILLWGDAERRIITGSDLLGRLLRGIVRRPDGGRGSVPDTIVQTLPMPAAADDTNA